MDQEFPGSVDLLQRELGKLHAQLAELRQTLSGLNQEPETGDNNAATDAEPATARSSVGDDQGALRDVHRSMRNILQVLAGMFELRSSRTIDLPRFLRDSRNRIDALGFLHQILSRSTSAEREELLLSYLDALTAHLYDTFAVDARRIRRVLEVSVLRVGFDSAVRVGLIVNELVSNALEHAFPDNATGRIAVAVRADEKGLAIEVGDDGIGLPRDVDLEQVETPGLRLVTMLVRQAGGRIILDRSQETRFVIMLPTACTGARGEP